MYTQKKVIAHALPNFWWGANQILLMVRCLLRLIYYYTRVEHNTQKNPPLQAGFTFNLPAENKNAYGAGAPNA